MQHTQTIAGSWWKVDLGDVYRLDSVVVYNRTTSAGNLLERLSDFYVFTSANDINGDLSLGDLQNDPSISHAFFAGAAGAQEEFPLDPIEGQYVMIKLSGSGPLHMAEVEVYGCEAHVCNVSLHSVSASPASQCGGSDGSISVIASGSNLEYSIDGGLSYQASPNFTNLVRGSYEVRARDALNPQCEVSYPLNPVVVGDPSAALVIQSVSPSHVTDCGLTDGMIHILATGPSLEYSIDGGQSFFPTPNFSGLDSGNYVVVIRDNSGSNCSLSFEQNPVRVDRPTYPEINSITHSDISDCGLVDGEIIINATGDNLEYSVDGGGFLSLLPYFPACLRVLIR